METPGDHEVVIPDDDRSASGVIFDTTDDGDYVIVIAKIPTPGARQFARLCASSTP